MSDSLDEQISDTKQDIKIQNHALDYINEKIEKNTEAWNKLFEENHDLGECKETVIQNMIQLETKLRLLNKEKEG